MVFYAYPHEALRPKNTFSHDPFKVPEPNSQRTRLAARDAIRLALVPQAFFGLAHMIRVPGGTYVFPNASVLPGSWNTGVLGEVGNDKEGGLRFCHKSCLIIDVICGNLYMRLWLVQRGCHLRVSKYARG